LAAGRVAPDPPTLAEEEPMSARLAAVAVALLLAPPAARAGEVRGQVRWTAAPPAQVDRATDRDRSVCGPSVAEESVLVAQGGLENVVVRIEVAGAVAAPRTLTLDQQGCRYRPRVQAAAPGSTLELRNGDPVLHNVHGYAGAATAFNVAMPTPGGKTPRLLARPGVIRIACDVHDWMSASVLVTATPHVAVTGPGGRFELKEVPAGSWQAVAWHEKHGERRVVIEVPARGAAALEFSYP
jgi:plastocyanin